MCDDFWQCKYCGDWNHDYNEICMKCWRDQSGYKEDCNFCKIHSWWCLPKYIPGSCGHCGYGLRNLYNTPKVPYYQCPKCGYINVDDTAFFCLEYEVDWEEEGD